MSKIKWAMGHPLLNMNPMLFAMSTLWIREHNRVCDALIKEWRSWTDDQVYNTARKIVIAEMMGIMTNDILNVHTERPVEIKFKPEVLDDRVRNADGMNTPFELLLTTMWPSSLPERFQNISISSMLFGDNKSVQYYNLRTFDIPRTNQGRPS